MTQHSATEELSDIVGGVAGRWHSVPELIAAFRSAEAR